MAKVHVLIIEHLHGTDVSVHETAASANRALETYCRNWWLSEYGHEPMPNDQSQLIARYFEKVFASEESWLIEECEVQP